MLSRRKFLKTNVATIAFPLAGSSAPATKAAESEEPNSSPATFERDYWNDWPLYLTAKVNAARAYRKTILNSLQSEEDVRNRIRTIREKVWELVGGPLDKTPLNSQTVGAIDRHAYRIEKVVFESRPEVYVTAHLYLPSPGNPIGPPPSPAIIAPLGHTRAGKEYRNYQYAYQNFARKGYVVLAFDPFGEGEREQYLSAKTGRSPYAPTGEHSKAGKPLLLLGATFAQYLAWDAIRAVDYLLTRPEVDPKRIGCTGHSGGGTMTMYLCSLEPRIQVAVEVEGNSENLAGPNYDPPGAVADAEQNLVGGLSNGIDRGDLLAAFAPKPLLVCYSRQDSGTTYSPQYEAGTLEIFDELGAVYKKFRAEEKVGLFASPLPHDFDFYSRRAAYEWFNRWLGKPEAGADEAEFDPAPEELLNCTSTGQVLTSLGGRSLVQINADRARELIAGRPYQANSQNLSAQREEIRKTLGRLLALPDENSSLNPRLLNSSSGQGLIVDEFDFRSEAEVRVPGWFIKPKDNSGPLPTVLVVSPRGKNRAVEEPNDMEAIARMGFAFCAVDLRGIAMASPRFPRAGPLFYHFHDPDMRDGYAWASLILGKPVLGQRVWDFIRTLDYLETRPDVNRDRIYVLGQEDCGLVALLGAVLDGRIRSMLLDHVPAEYLSFVEAEDYEMTLDWFIPGVLQKFDLPELIGTLPPRQCWLVNAANAAGVPLDELTLKSLYKAAALKYTKEGQAGQLKLIVQPDEEFRDTLDQWLRGE